MYWINKIRQLFLVRLGALGLMLLPLASPVLPPSLAASPADSIPNSDPPTFIYETTYDGVWLESGRDVVVDADGNAYVLTYAYEDNNDVQVLKLDPAGAVLWTVYINGSALDYGTGIAVDAAGDVYITGWTDSSDFPTVNPLQGTRNGFRDAFIAKLSGADGSFIFSTYFGGSRSEGANDIAVNAAGEIYLTGYTSSTDLPTVNPIQPNLNTTQCFCDDTFVSKLSADGGTLLYSTYLGGSFDDAGDSIALDANDNIYLAGNTKSGDFPLQNPTQPTYGGGTRDVFAARILADGSALDYGTYLGGEEFDRVGRIAVDGANSLYVAGTTRSIGFPTTAGAFQEQFVGGILECGSPPYEPLRNCDDAFVTKLTPDGSGLAYSTFLGGGLSDEARGIALDSDGNAYIVGYTASPDFPPNVQGAVMFLSQLSASGSDLGYTLAIDADGSPNQGHGVALDAAGDIYVAGAKNVPSDVYVAKLAGVPSQPSDTLHVEEIRRRSSNSERRRAIEIEILIEDQNDAAVEGAQVIVAAVDPSGKPVELTSLTDAQGWAAFDLNSKRGGTWQVCVIDVVKQGFTYDPSANGETCDSFSH